MTEKGHPVVADVTYSWPVNSAPPPSGQPQVADEPVRPTPSSTSRDRIPMVVWLLLCAAFVVILNETIMSLALDTLMKSLGITAAQGQWLTTAFLLTMAGGIRRLRAGSAQYSRLTRCFSSPVRAARRRRTAAASS